MSEEPEPKRLRSSEPDLRVSVGAEHGDAKEYQYHSQAMALQSGFIDTALATPMNKGNQPLCITFPDITAELWETMLKYLDPKQARSLDMQTAMKLAPLYDKYSFESGLSVCDDVLAGVFISNSGKQNFVQHKHAKPNPDLDTLIDIFVMANDAHLQETVKQGVVYFRETLTASPRFRYGRAIFTMKQIKRLVPMIVEKKLLRKEGCTRGNGGWTDKDIRNPMFPELFVLRCKNAVRNKALLEDAVVGVHLSGSSSNADGDFTWDGFLFECGRKVAWPENGDGRQVQYTIFIGCIDGDWLIYGRSDPAELDEDGDPIFETVRTKIMWRNPYSANLPLPPMTGWESVDEVVGGNPTLEYIYREN